MRYVPGEASSVKFNVNYDDFNDVETSNALQQLIDENTRTFTNEREKLVKKLAAETNKKYMVFAQDKPKIVHNINNSTSFKWDLNYLLVDELIGNQVGIDLDIVRDILKNESKLCPRCKAKHHTTIKTYEDGRTVECLSCGGVFEVE